MDSRQPMREVRRPTTARCRRYASGSRNGASGSAQSPIQVGAGPEIVDLDAECESPDHGKAIVQGESSSHDEPFAKRARTSSSSSSSRPPDATDAAAVQFVRGGDALRRMRRHQRPLLGRRFPGRSGGGGGGGGGVTLGRVPEVDASSEQIREDERLARQLQETFASEAGASDAGASGSDADLALSLQEEERQRVRQRDRQPDRYQRMAMYMEASQAQREAIRRVREHMNSLMRRRLPMQLAYVDRDFNEDDYEMLLALDEGVKQRGASETTINALPVTEAVETDKSEPCSICLDVPESGEQIRRLPCMHCFHQACIDTWLKRRANCPVCKVSI